MGGAQLVHIGIARICINHVLTSPITPCPPSIDQFSDICGPHKDHKGYGSAAIFQGNFNTRLYNKRDVYAYYSTCRDLIKKSIFLSWFHDEVINNLTRNEI
jgi:hypothetical protein